MCIIFQYFNAHNFILIFIWNTFEQITNQNLVELIARYIYVFFKRENILKLIHYLRNKTYINRYNVM